MGVNAESGGADRGGVKDWLTLTVHSENGNGDTGTWRSGVVFVRRTQTEAANLLSGLLDNLEIIDIPGRIRFSYCHRGRGCPVFAYGKEKPMKTELRAGAEQRRGGAAGLGNQTNAGIGVPIALRRPSWLSPTVWPFEASAISINGHALAFTDVGQGPVLLFVHTGFWSFVWRDVIQRLAPEFRCVCFDAPGTGRSDRLPASEINLASASRALVALVRTLNLQDITLIFHDLGGPSGIAGAATLAERFRGLCAVNTFAWRPSGLPFRFMLGVMGGTAMREFDAITGILPRITSSAFGIGRRMDEQSRKAFLAGIGRQGVRSFHSYMRDAAKSKAIYAQLDEALDGPFGRLPLLTIFGERNDPLGFQPRWKNLFPDVQQVVVSGGNHFPMCDDPALVASSIRAWHRERVRSAGQGDIADAARNDLANAKKTRD